MSADGCLLLGSPPSNWDDSQTSKVHARISDPILQHVEPVGPQYLAHARRKLYNRTFSEDDDHLAAEAEAKAKAEAALLSQDEDLTNLNNLVIEPDHKDDLKRDPRDWKAQDHYRLLGLGTMRWRATPAMIKKAHRTKVLVHHPDKKTAAAAASSNSRSSSPLLGMFTSNSTPDADNDSYFKCLQRAYEFLSDPVKRRQYDSVDPIPEESYQPIQDPADQIEQERDAEVFIEAWRPVFERESRFSAMNHRKIPSLGTEDSTKAEVEAFYGFWYSFDSWRSFEYLDSEEGDAAENRDDKRYLEKKNKAERMKRKKEDTARLRKLVDTAFSIDPRMAAFKEQDRLAKEAKKQEKLAQVKLAKMEAENEARIAKEQEQEKEAVERVKREEERKEREAKKKLIRKEKKTIKTLIKDANYYCEKGTSMTPSKLEIYLSELETLLDKVTLEDLERIRDELLSKKLTHEDKVKILMAAAQQLVIDGLAQPESLSQFGADAVERPIKTVEQPIESPTTVTSGNVPTKEWSVEEVAFLIKAANKFPGGVSDRWETIAAFVAKHTGLPQRDPEDVIRKSKAVKKASSTEASVNKQLQSHKKTFEIRDAPSVRYDIEGEIAPIQNSGTGVKATAKTKKTGSAPVSSAQVQTPASSSSATPMSSKSATPVKATSPMATTAAQKEPASESSAATTATTPDATAAPAASLWTAQEQKLLEAGMKAYPPSWKGEGDRWDKVAESVPGRTKKECKLRVKFLQDQIKAQRAAAAATGSK
ncbi:hypothetical protein BGW38_003068 [Lunasporangiospora selenospora]|uniref:DnaJ homolog subfamily C member 2 n=1 Tax=Lunasporangiospora selenospora TaxID=979761 RepID=A0A9P6FRI3_9FUNG|nr:hypothetical protein BGW38_003068 [Lunasporangiospora selenospora]